MSEFKFAIGDYVTFKAHVDFYELHEVSVNVVVGRLAEQCPGGEQRHYAIRSHYPMSRIVDTAKDFLKANEVELVALDVEAYKAARRGASTWSNVMREAKALANTEPKPST